MNRSFDKKNDKEKRNKEFKDLAKDCGVTVKEIKNIYYSNPGAKREGILNPEIIKQVREMCV